jgi:hypothetical protein
VFGFLWSIIFDRAEGSLQAGRSSGDDSAGPHVTFRRRRMSNAGGWRWKGSPGGLRSNSPYPHIRSMVGGRIMQMARPLPPGQSVAHAALVPARTSLAEVLAERNLRAPGWLPGRWGSSLTLPAPANPGGRSPALILRGDSAQGNVLRSSQSSPAAQSLPEPWEAGDSFSHFVRKSNPLSTCVS